jgi:hypothetical protein
MRYHSFLTEWGWFASWRSGRPIDANGAPIPWFTYPSIRFMEQRVTAGMSVFEYGCGGSTYWWAARVASVDSCESDPNWFAVINATRPVNVRLELRPLETYASSVLTRGRLFDIVVVDGRRRVECMKLCLSALSLDGIVILDNAERQEYSEGIAHLLSEGFRELPFDGPAPIVFYSYRTSIFYRPSQNVFGI